MEEEGGAAEEETDGPADTDGHLRVELRPQHLRAHGEDDSQVPEPGTLIIPTDFPSQTVVGVFVFVRSSSATNIMYTK